MGVNESEERDAPIGWSEFVIRALWVGLRLLLVFWMAEAGQSFVYQSF